MGDKRREELEAQLAALSEIERRKRENPLYYFNPIPKAEPFFSHRANLRIFAGGNRSGKTEHGAAEDAAFALGYRPWVLRKHGIPCPNPIWERPRDLPEEAICFTGAGVRVQVPNTGAVVTGLSMRQGIGQTIAPKLRALLGPAIESEHVSHAGTPADIKLRNGSQIVFLSDEQPSLAFESFAVQWAHMDEPCKRRVYTGLRRASIDSHARMWLSFTPLGANSNWIFKDLYSKSDDKNIATWTISLFDNCYLSKEAVEEFARDPAISDVERDARLYGKFPHLVDRVYPQFDADIHVVEPFQVPNDWFHGMVVDPHSARPHAIIYFSVDPRGRIYVTREWPTNDFTKLRRDTRDIQSYALLIRELDGDKEISLRLMDPNAGPRRETMRGVYVASWVDLFAQYGLHFQTGLNDKLDFGENSVRQLLHYNPHEPISAANEPKLFIFSNCANTIASLSFYTYKSANTPDAEIKEDAREETYKHFSDCIRYLCVSGAARAALEDSPSYMPSFDGGDAGDDASYSN